MKQLGMSGAPTTVIAGVSADIRNGLYEIENNDLENLPGRKSVSLRAVLKNIYKL